MNNLGNLPAILVVEDVEPMRALLGELISQIPGVRLAGTARSVAEARRLLLRNRPELVLLDEVLPGESSQDLLNELTGQKIPVLLLTSMEDPAHPVAPGALGRLVKPEWPTLEEDRARLTRAVQKALAIPARNC